MYKKYTLDNGICLVCEAMPFAKTVSVGVWVRAGSMYESAEENGISHFIEHMLFKGTKRRSAYKLAEEMDFIGGQMNAYTARECTCYYTKTLPESMEISLDLLSDMYYNSLFKEEDIELERSVITEEINMYEDSPEDVALDELCGYMWQNNPLGYPVSGTVKTVGALTKKQMTDYMKRRYTPENTVISVAGCFDEKKLLELCNKYFSEKGLGEAQKPAAVEIFGGRWERVKDIEQVHLSMGFPAFDMKSESIYPLAVLNNIFGGSMSGRLFQSVREKHGLCYSIYSYTGIFPDTGMLGIYAGLNPDMLDRAERVIGEEIEKLCSIPISDYELQRARAQIKCGIIMSMESVTSVMTENGKAQLLKGSIRQDSEIIERIERVTADDVKKTAQQIFGTDKKAVFVLRPKN